jgi:hypothetical protein
LVVFVVVVFVGHSLRPRATPLSSMAHLPPRATGRTYVCHPSTSSRRWTRRRPWITPVTSGSKTAWSIVLHLNSTRACALPRRLPSPRRNGHSFVWLRHQWRTASLVAVRAGVSAWKPPRKKPSPPLPLLPPLTPQRSFGPLALIPRSTAQKPRYVFSYSLNLSRRCFTCLACLWTSIRNRRRFAHPVRDLYLLPLNFPFSQVPARSMGAHPSSTSSLERVAPKAARCESDRCLSLRRSTRQSLSQTQSYSTHHTTSYNSGARPDPLIWKNGIYSGPVNKNGYSRGPAIFRAMEAAKKKDAEATKNSGADSLN